MKKNVFITLFLMFCGLASVHALEMTITPFRINYIVYYQILYKMQGISMNEFKNVKVISDTGKELIFEYGGKQYKATVFGGQGIIYVTMPDGMRNRYISQQRFPAIILTDFDKR